MMKILIGKRSLRVALILPFVMLTVLSVAVVGAVSYYSGRRAVRDMTLQLQREIRGRIEDRLHWLLDQPRQVVRINADLIARRVLPPGDPGALEDSFREQVRLLPALTSVYFGNTSGGLANSGREPDTDVRYVMHTEAFSRGLLEKHAVDGEGNRTGLLGSVPGFDARTRPWFAQVVVRNTAAWSPIYVLSTGQDMAVTYSLPVYDRDHSLLGVAASDVFLSQLSRFLQSIRIGNKGQCFLFERSGLLIASSTDGRPFTGDGGAEPYRRRRVHECVSPVIRSATASLSGRFDDYHAIGESQNVSFEIDGERHSLGVSAYHDPDGLDWLVGIVVSESDFMSEIEANNRDMILLIAGALVVTLIVGFHASQRITRPVLRLHRSALTLAGGEWPPALDADSSIREIDGLTESFDHMASALRQAMERLSHEVAERARTEGALRQSEERYRLLFDNIRDAAFVHLLDERDGPGRFIQVNEEACRRLGYSREELLRMTPLDIGLAEAADRRLWIDQAIETRGSALFETTHVAKDGRRINVESHVSRLTLGDERIVLSISRDITERKRVEEALRESEERWQFALEGAGDGVWDWSVETGKVFYSRQWKAMLGYEEAEIGDAIGEWEQRIHREDRSHVDEAIAKHFSGQAEVYVSEHRLRGKDGAYRWILDRGKAVRRTEDGRPLRMIGTHTDITDRKKAEEEGMRLERQLQQARKTESLSRMAGAIAHNFNNMLGVVIGNLEMVLDDLPAGSHAHQGVSDALKGSWRAAEVSRLMLTYLGQTVGRKEPLDLAKTIEESLALIGASTPGHVTLKAGLSSGRPIIEADRVHLRQILSNLVSNALEAIGEAAGDITVALDVVAAEAIHASRFFPSDWSPRTPYYACLSVSDTGSGLDAAAIDQIFDPFFSTRFPGRGLGLPVVLGLMRSYEGAITVESHPGHGAVFRLYLPLSESGVASFREAPPDSERSERKGLVLVVDDEAMMRDMAAILLQRKLGFEVVTARDGYEALEIFRGHKEKTDLVLLDLSMPGMDGWETLAGLRALRSDIPVILASGYDEAQVMKGSFSEQPQAFLHKPYGLEDLRRALASCRLSREGR